MVKIMAKLYILQKGQKSVKYANGRPPWMKHNTWQVVSAILFIIIVSQTIYYNY